MHHTPRFATILLTLAGLSLGACNAKQDKICAATIDRSANGPTTQEQQPPPTTQPVADAAPAERLTFPDAVTLTNPLIRLEVAPSVGRITHLGPINGENLLFIATESTAQTTRKRDGTFYRNLGGDKIWPQLQALWDRVYGPPGGWPPDGIIDGQPWKLIEQTDRQITMESLPDPRLGIQVRRQITLDAKEPAVTIHNTITRFKANHFPVHIWSVTQVVWPEYVFMDIAHDRAMEKTWAGDAAQIKDLLTIREDQSVARFEIAPQKGKGLKANTLGRWLAAVYPDYVFYQHTDFDPTGMYLDESNIQVYFDGNYTELETLSPMLHLQPGEKLTNTVTWRLIPKGQMSDEAIIEKARTWVSPTDKLRTK